LLKRLLGENWCKNSAKECKNSAREEGALLSPDHRSFHIRGFVLKPFLPCFNLPGNSISELAVDDQGKS
jgi:hypothetical protein